MNAVTVPYRSARPLRGCARPQRLAGLAGSSRKRNGDAFMAAFPGVNWASDSQITLPGKFGGIVLNRGGFDELAGAWYGATYHPDGDQAGWQQKFEAALKKFGAYNAYYGASAAPSLPPTGLIPSPVAQAAPVSPPTLTMGATIVGYAVNAEYAPLYAGSDNRLYFKTGNGYAVYIGPVSQTPQPVRDAPTPQAIFSSGQTPGFATPPTTLNVPATVPPDNTSALIAQLMAKGASQDQAFAAALQSLVAQGVPPTPQVQQQVANDVAAVSSGPSPMILIAGGVTAAILIGILASRRGRK